MTFQGMLDRENNLDTHILSLVHDLSINNSLMRTNTVIHCVRGVCACSNLDLSPLLVSRDKASFVGESLELLVDTLFFNAALSLDEW